MQDVSLECQTDKNVFTSDVVSTAQQEQAFSVASLIIAGIQSRDSYKSTICNGIFMFDFVLKRLTVLCRDFLSQPSEGC